VSRTRALIGLGSNLGDRSTILDAAVAALGERPETRLIAVSRYHETRPVGGPEGQGDFLNAAAVVETTLGPHELLAFLHEIERRAGRVRTVRWGERTLDLDLLLYGDRVIDTHDLQVPHPRMAERRFVLAPLAEVAPGAVEPVTGCSIAELLERLDRQAKDED
jgi:2-amino-4-hydroxy-6-hydroxymethyldihydropteridine diphosphokinase